MIDLFYTIYHTMCMLALDLTSSNADKGDDNHDDDSEVMDIYVIDEPGSEPTQQMPEDGPLEQLIIVVPDELSGHSTSKFEQKRSTKYSSRLNCKCIWASFTFMKPLILKCFGLYYHMDSYGISGDTFG